MLTVTPKAGHLMVQATGQGEFEVFPESDTRLFYRVVDAQITFELAPDGTASALVLHQNGRDRRGYDHPEERADAGAMQQKVGYRRLLVAAGLRQRTVNRNHSGHSGSIALHAPFRSFPPRIANPPSRHRVFNGCANPAGKAGAAAPFRLRSVENNARSWTETP